MVIQYNTGSVTFGAEEQDYFSRKLEHLQGFFGRGNNNPDMIATRITIDKNRHHRGDRFECSAHMVGPDKGNFHATVAAENMKKCADLAYDKLKTQVKRWHDKH